MSVQLLLDIAQREYNYDLLDRLSNYQLERLYSAYHALRDWYTDLLLDDDQRRDLSHVRLMAVRQRARGEMAMPTTLLTSMALRNMDNDDVQDIIPRLILDYYSEH
ncbi:hypothetical protein GGI03_003925 [Coemansia sp. RSA 2337]|nr:hypothetical protein GGI03_003925 [Coemansia sp. RSA 2337]